MTERVGALFDDLLREPTPEQVQAARQSLDRILSESPNPQAHELQERAFQHFAARWCTDPWRAEQARRNGEGWLRACFNSAPLAHAAPVSPDLPTDEAAN